MDKVLFGFGGSSLAIIEWWWRCWPDYLVSQRITDSATLHFPDGSHYG